jgi:hypothetical protein
VSENVITTQSATPKKTDQGKKSGNPKLNNNKPIKPKKGK